MLYNNEMMTMDKKKVHSFFIGRKADITNEIEMIMYHHKFFFLM